MPPFPLLAPLFALAAWTGCILLLLAYRRVRAALQGRAPTRAYALGEAPDVPLDVQLPNRNYMNLLELPVLFYVVCLVASATGRVPDLALPLAWLYVALRVVHSLIHITYNHVLHRFAAFAASNVTLLILWWVVGWAVFQPARLAG